MGGIGLGCRQPQPNTSHTYAHRTQIQDTHIQSYTSTTYICTEQKTQQYPDTPVHKQTQYPHTIRTQFAHNFHTIRTHTNTENDNMQYIEQNTDTSTENKQRTAHNLNRTVHTIIAHIVLIFIMNMHI